MPESPTVLPLPTPPAEDVWSVGEHSREAFAKRLQAPPTDRDWHELRREAERIALVPGFERLITLDANAIKALPHQIDVAQRVLRHMSGRAILADEVGLGKTIEASIIYKELAIRGLARRVLILTPASLVRSEEHTSELQSQSNLVCRLLLEKKKKEKSIMTNRRREEHKQTE